VERPVSDRRMTWLVVGVLAGLCISYFWPHEPAMAITTDRNSKFAMASCPVSIVDSTEATFVLDFLTGRLQGAVLNDKFGKFTHSYYRNIAADFEIDQKRVPMFAIIGGQCQLPSRGRVTVASGVIYIGELNSGMVIAYGFPYNDSRRKLPPVEMTVLDRFQFRAPIGSD